jgi:hypothetical protein
MLRTLKRTGPLMQAYQHIDALLLFAGGAFCTFFVFGGVPADTTKQIEWQQWYAKWRRMLKVLGPLMMAMGLLQVAFKLAS